jgi:acyl-CoA synthetase (AMP-forming)/AMP-acid ligase II
MSNAETVYQLFAESAARYAANDCLVAPAMAGRAYYPDGATLTYGEVAARVAALADAYRAAGYGVGHRVALLLENRPEFHLHWIALNGLGVGIVPLAPALGPEELAYQLGHAETVLAVSVPERVAELAAVAAACEKPFPVLDAEALPATLPPPRHPAAPEPPGLDTESALLYTSGTTGRPKGCVLNNFYFLNAGRWYLEAGGAMDITPGAERLLSPLPLHHANALAISSMAMLTSGGCMIMVDRFHPSSWWRDVAETRATIVHYLGIMPPLLLNQEAGPHDRAHCVKFGAGAGIDPDHHIAFEKRFGFPLVEGWGMTEVAMPVWASREPRQIDTRAMGRVLTGCAVRIHDEEDKPVPPDIVGELVLRADGPEPMRGLFSGYLKDPAATGEAWRGGWFHTGDAVRQDADGILYFVDRIKNIIRRSGENIAAAEIEAVLHADDRVAQAAVIAVEDPLRQEEVMACIRLAPGVAESEETARALQDLCLARLAYYKAPAYILFVASLPTTGTQKVQKTKLFSADTDPRAAPGCFDLGQRKKRPNSA